jgi:hypothetical protein
MNWWVKASIETDPRFNKTICFFVLKKTNCVKTTGPRRAVGVSGSKQGKIRPAAGPSKFLGSVQPCLSSSVYPACSPPLPLSLALGDNRATRRRRRPPGAQVFPGPFARSSPATSTRQVCAPLLAPSCCAKPSARTLTLSYLGICIRI